MANIILLCLIGKSNFFCCSAIDYKLVRLWFNNPTNFSNKTLDVDYLLFPVNFWLVVNIKKSALHLICLNLSNCPVTVAWWSIINKLVEQNDLTGYRTLVSPVSCLNLWDGWNVWLADQEICKSVLWDHLTIQLFVSSSEETLFIFYLVSRWFINYYWINAVCAKGHRSVGRDRDQSQIAWFRCHS